MVFSLLQKHQLVRSIFITIVSLFLYYKTSGLFVLLLGLSIVVNFGLGKWIHLVAASKKQKTTFGLQHSMLVFRNFYTKQAAKALFGKTSLVKNPSLINQLSQPMNVLTNKEVKQIDKKVILDAEDATSLIQNLQVKAIALKGKEDYVPTPPKIETIVVEGGHISPLEKPEEVLNLIKKLTK
jgi:hypothetical protein